MGGFFVLGLFKIHSGKYGVNQSLISSSWLLKKWNSVRW